MRAIDRRATCALCGRTFLLWAALDELPEGILVNVEGRRGVPCCLRCVESREPETFARELGARELDTVHR